MPTPEATPRNDQVICPNCCHQFQAICVDDQERMRDLERRLSRVAGVLEELIELKDLHDRIERGAFPNLGELGCARTDYLQRKPKAWEAARTELAALEGKHGTE